MKLFLDFLPLLVFFAAFKLSGLMAATAALVAATLVALGATYAREKRLAITPLVTAVVVTIFGGLTLYLNDDIFIKLKPTLVNLLFAAILLGGLLRGKALLKPLLGAALEMPDAAWRILTRRWAAFFLLLAGLNELVWRTQTTEFWVNFKVFGLMGLLLAFSLAQAPFLKKHGAIKG